MPHLALFLFGGFKAELDGQSLTGFGTDKNRALLAYLALDSGRPHRREALAALLWPDQPEAAARNSLRQALYQLRHLLPHESETEPYLLITSEQVRFNQASDHSVDVLEFKSLLSACQSHHQPGDLELCAGCLESLQRAVDLYQGEMLEGLTLARCDQFTDWQIFSQEECHRQALAAISLLADVHENSLDYARLIACTQKAIKLEPWLESAYQRQMWALAMTGQRKRALLLFNDLRNVLQHEMGLPPSVGTRRLYEQIRDGLLPGQRAVEDRLFVSTAPTHQTAVKSVIPFAGRQVELAQLNSYLSDSLAGQGRVAFVSGEAGSGKTALLLEFARQAVNSHDDLLVAGGTCSAYRGLGDPFQPFREILGSLAGTSPVPSPTGDPISEEHTRRLRAAVPVLLQTLLETGPGLVGTLLPAQSLLHRARKTPGLDAATAASLETLAAHPVPEQAAAASPEPLAASLPSETSWMPRDLYDQVVRLLQAFSHRFPLLILIDNLQWSDSATSSLLFHLGSHLSGGRILLLGAYRSEDIISTWDRPRHPMDAALKEFQRRFGETLVDLSCADGRAFVRTCLDSMPNNFGRDFRETLYRHTGGNALFTVELLRAMQARGELVKDKAGQWDITPDIDWEKLPARVEAIITERIDRLDRECLTLLEAASVQGEVFIVPALANVLGVSEDEINTYLSGPLCKQHQLVSRFTPQDQDHCLQACYQFRHTLFQKHLYNNLDESRRVSLHQATVKALVRLFCSTLASDGAFTDQ
jgi:DNA-binding SARP family transcriptional activator